MNGTVRDWMTPQVSTLEPERTVGDARKAMRGYRLLPLVRDGDFVGFVHQAALVGLPDDETLARTTIEDPWTIEPAMPIDAALLRLRTTMDDVLWVVEDDALVGVFTEHDAMRLAAAALEGSTLMVGQFATPAPRTVDIDAPVSKALSTMVQLWVRHLPVLAEGSIAGVLSWRDLVGRDPALPVRELVNPAITVVSWRTPMAVAAARLVQMGTGSAAVLDEEGQLEGILTRLDVIRALIEPVGQPFV